MIRYLNQRTSKFQLPHSGARRVSISYTSSVVTDRVQTANDNGTHHSAGGEKIMAILEEIAVSASKPAETRCAILITIWQHENRPFSGSKTRAFGRSGGFWW